MNDAPESFAPVVEPTSFELQSPDHSHACPFRIPNSGVLLVLVFDCETVTTWFTSVVVIFDEDRDNRYTYMTTWLGEHQNESDMAFYSTFPFDNLVGPGIGRGEYGIGCPAITAAGLPVTSASA